MDLEKIFVSVIIPTYNRANTLEDAIQSVLGQTFQDFELIIVDDGSTDNTEEVVSYYITVYSNKIKYIYKTNGGVSSARNEGIRNAKGNYIAFLDSDDYCDVNKLEITAKFIIDYPEAGLFYTDVWVVDENKNILWANDRFHYRGNVFTKLIERDFITTSTVVVKKQVFEKVGRFFEGYSLKAGLEDWDMWLRIAKYYGFYHIPKKLTYYRHYKGQYRFKKEFFADYELLLERFLNCGQNIAKKKIKKIYSSYYYSKGKSYLASDERRSARKNISQSIKLNPLSIRSYIVLGATFLPKSLLDKLKYKLKIA